MPWACSRCLSAVPCLARAAAPAMHAGRPHACQSHGAAALLVATCVRCAIFDMLGCRWCLHFRRLRDHAFCCAATATVVVSSIEASYDQQQRVWFNNDGPPAKMRVLFGMISWCNQTGGFTAQVRETDGHDSCS